MNVIIFKVIYLRNLYLHKWCKINYFKLKS